MCIKNRPFNPDIFKMFEPETPEEKKEREEWDAVTADGLDDEWQEDGNVED